MRAIVLGSAAGGGFPQWNCGCENCVAVRARREGFAPRTQDSLVVGEGDRWVLVNASPDVLGQIQSTRALWPRAPRHTPIGAVVLTNGDLDHVLGLFSLRESQPLAVYATASVWRGLSESVFVRTLRRFEGQLVARELVLGETFTIEDALGEPVGVTARAFALAGKPPVHLVGRAAPSAEDNVGLVLGAAGSPTLAYAAACGSLEGVDLDGHAAVLFDGTFYTEDELVRLGLGEKLAKEMAHVPIGGPAGSLHALASLAGRRVYTHVNNTNPILAPSSDERRAVERAGWEIAHDGMEIAL
jgi:pyrroloquinoline quinone biosynthesis protein B